MRFWVHQAYRAFWGDWRISFTPRLTTGNLNLIVVVSNFETNRP